MCFRGECPFSGNSFNFRLLCIFCKGSSYLKFLPFSPLHFVLLPFCSINNENQNLGEKPWLNYINLAKSKSGVTVYWTFSWDNYRNSHKSKSLLITAILSISDLNGHWLYWDAYLRENLLLSGLWGYKPT